ncbi:calcium-dependent phosphotriesterase [Clathrospora elynae]|uniref:Calcium-dependent phosphotriesterase n=1 Tax=Clathrospora elynae TaxID=706981 RepID=A0A6A5T6X7_9PLEO|nr:calcium-dependent phosphotriesterase [Clathrospora elynae]
MDEPMFLICNVRFNDILGAHADIKLSLQEDIAFAYQAGVYDSKGDFIHVTSNQIGTSIGTEKIVVISKLTRNLYGDEGVAYNDGILDGVLFCSQGDVENPAGLVHIEFDYPFRIRNVVNNYHGRRFNSPKDAAIHSNGSVWFTDPIYGYDQWLRPVPELLNQVYRFDPHTGDVRVMVDGFGRPSGICFSPYEKVCYISDTDFIHGDGNIEFTRASTMYAYDIKSAANVGLSDGLSCDTTGNVYAVCGDGLSIWSPGGVLLGKVLVPGGLANFCFGKKGELFLLNDKKFWVLKVVDTIKGAVLNREGARVEEQIDLE